MHLCDVDWMRFGTPINYFNYMKNIFFPLKCSILKVLSTGLSISIIYSIIMYAFEKGIIFSDFFIYGKFFLMYNIAR